MPVTTAEFDIRQEAMQLSRPSLLSRFACYALLLSKCDR